MNTMRRIAIFAVLGIVGSFVIRVIVFEHRTDRKVLMGSVKGEIVERLGAPSQQYSNPNGDETFIYNGPMGLTCVIDFDHEKVLAVDHFGH